MSAPVASQLARPEGTRSTGHSPLPTRVGVLAGLGVCVPRQAVPNEALSAGLDTSDEWIRQRTGICARRVADAGVATSDLAAAAGRSALEAAGGTADAVLVATMTPDHTCPATAPQVAASLGLQGAAAFDVGAACAGFVAALATANGLIATQAAERVLVIGAETMTRIADPTDRDTAMLFGDGAGAVVLRAGEPDEAGAVGPFDLGSDGSGVEILHIPAGGSRAPATAGTVAAREHYLRMAGREVYRHAVRRMVESSQRVVQRAGWELDTIDRLVAHQANARILHAVGDRLGIPEGRRVCNIDRYANTSAASIPLALADADARPGHRVLLTAFGAGLAWGSTLLTWPDLPPTQRKELP